MISDYRFGKIVIDGVTYTQDVIIYPNKVDSNWWRSQGHLLQESDLLEVLNEIPECLVIGTGAYGLMKVQEELIKKLESNGIKVIVGSTTEVSRQYNELNQMYKVIAALHLTC